MRGVLTVALLLLAGCTRSFIQDEEQVVVRRNLVFAEIDGRTLKLDLYLPRERNGPTPVVVWIHGGSWLYGTHHDCRIDWLAEEGFAVASIAFRSSLVAKWPAQIHDSKAAVRWLRAHADEYGLRDDRIAAAGMSAGAHLALMLGLTDGDPEFEGAIGGDFEQPSGVQAVISYYGPTDLDWFGVMSRSANWPSEPISLLLGVAPRNDPELARQASPLYHIRPSSPPVLLIHGEDDFVVPPSQSEAFHHAYREESLSSALVVVANAGHYGGDRYFGREGPRPQVLEFLRRNLLR